MEVGAIAGCRNESGTNGEIAEALSLLPLDCVGGEKRIEYGNDARVIEILGVKLVHARTVEGRAEVQVVSTWAFAESGIFGGLLSSISNS